MLKRNETGIYKDHDNRRPFLMSLLTVEASNGKTQDITVIADLWGKPGTIPISHLQYDNPPPKYMGEKRFHFGGIQLEVEVPHQKSVYKNPEMVTADFLLTDYTINIEGCIGGETFDIEISNDAKGGNTIAGIHISLPPIRDDDGFCCSLRLSGIALSEAVNPAYSFFHGLETE